MWLIGFRLLVLVCLAWAGAQYTPFPGQPVYGALIGLAGGALLDHLGVSSLVVVSATVALALAWWADLLPQRPAGPLGIDRREVLSRAS